MTIKVMFSLPEQLVARMKATIPRERSKVLAILFEKEINTREQNLYLKAKELEECMELKEEIATWDKEFEQDGLDNAPEKLLSIKIYFNNSKVCAVIDPLRALDKTRFIRLDGDVSLHEMSMIENSLRHVLAL